MIAPISQFTSRIKLSRWQRLGLAALVVAAVWMAGYYLWPYLKGAPAGAALQYTWDFYDTSDVDVSGNVTVADGYASVDLAYTAGDFGDHRRVTDLLSLGLTHLVAAVTDSVAIISGGGVAYSEDLGQTWSSVGVPIASPTIIQQLSYGPMFTETRIYAGGVAAMSPSPTGIFTYASCGASCATANPADWPWAASALPVPGVQSVGAITTNGIWMVAGVALGTPSVGTIFTANADLTGQANQGGSDIPYNYQLPGTSAVNDLFYGPGGTLYATTTDSTGSHPSTIWYTQDQGLNWTQADLVFSPTLYSHNATYGITADEAGYIYVTTDRGYILKSATSGGTEFAMMSGMLGDMLNYAKTIFVYQNNLFIPASNSIMYRSVDYDPATGFTNIFACSPGAGSTTANEVVRAVWDDPFHTKIILAVNAPDAVPPTAGILTAVFAGSSAVPETITSTNTLRFSSVSSLAMTLPLSSMGAMPPRFRLANHLGGQWYYYDSQDSRWRISYSVSDTESNTLAEANLGITKFAEQVGQGEFYYQFIFPSAFDLQPIVVDDIVINYANDFAITGVNPSSGSIAGGYTVDVIGTDFNMFTQVKFDGSYSPNIQFIDSTHIIAEVPVSPTGSGPVDVTAVDMNGGFIYESAPLLNGFEYQAISSIEVSAPAYTALNTDFALTVTMLDESGDPLTNFSEPVAIDSASTSGGSVIFPNSIGNIPGDWNNGSVTGTFQINEAGNHIILAGYTDALTGQSYSGSAATITVDVDQEPVASFDVQVIPPTQDPDTDFSISLTAFTEGDFIKTNFINPVTLKADANGDGVDDGYLDPMVIGDGNIGGSHGTWDQGQVAYNYYKISQPGIYAVIANYNNQDLGQADMTVSGGLTIPSIQSLNPNHGPALGGTHVAIVGDNFVGNIGVGNGIVMFGGLTATVIDWSDTLITVVSPPSIPGVSMPVKVTRPDGETSLEQIYFTYDEGPRIDTLTPNSGPVSGGTLVAIAGSNFGSGLGTGSRKVEFGIQTATIIYWSNDLIRVLSPNSLLPATVMVKVTRTDGLASNEVAYEYTQAEATPQFIRYHSPVFATPEEGLISLNDIIIIADGYSEALSEDEDVDILLGLFDENWIPIGPGDDALDENGGYYILSGYPDTLDNTAKLAELSQLQNFSAARYLRFRIYLYSPVQVSASTPNTPWVASIDLEVTLAAGTVGHLVFVNDESSKTISEVSPTATFNMNAIADNGFTGSYDIQLALVWRNNNAPAGVTAEIVPDTLIAFSAAPIVHPFQVQFTAGAGAVFDDSDYQFQITGIDINNPNITLELMTIYGALTLQSPPHFEVGVVDADQVVVQGEAIDFDVTVTGQNAFSGAVTLTNNAASQFAVGRITSALFNPNPVTIPDGETDPVPAALTIETSDLVAGTDDLDKWVTFAISGTDADGNVKDIDVQLYILSQPVPDGEFVLVVSDPIKEAQPNSAVSYGITVVYGPTFNGTIGLSTDTATIFTDVTAEFDMPVLSYGDKYALLTLTIGTNPTPLDTATAFNITGTSNTGSLVVNATPTPILTINSIVSDTITIQLTVPVQDKPQEVLPSLFTLNLYNPGELDKNAFVVSLSGLAPTSQDIDNKIIIVDAVVSKDLLTDGATYQVYTRSTRHFWTQATADLTVNLAQTTPHAVTFPTLVVGDIRPTTQDNVINAFDVTYTVNNWFKQYPDISDPSFLICDFNDDNMINAFDVTRVVNNWFMTGDELFN